MAQKLNSIIAEQLRPAPVYVDAKSLAANVAESFTVPAGYHVAIFGASAAPFYVKVGTAPTATVPVDTADGTASEASPTAYRVEPAQVISVIAPVATIVTIAYYRSL